MRELRKDERAQVSGGCKTTDCQLPPPILELYPHIGFGGPRVGPGPSFMPGPDPFRPFEYSQ